jgi:hypothetical protein
MIKGVGSAALGAAAEKTEGDAGAVLALLGITAQLFAEVSERADLRVSRYFPARAYAGGINLKPGRYSFWVRYYGGTGRELASIRYENMQVVENNLNLAEAVCLK